MDGWEIALWAAAAYTAVLTLVRFMSARRTAVLEELRQRADAQPRPPAKKSSAAGRADGLRK